MTNVIQDKITDIQDSYLRKQPSNTDIHEALEMFQDIQTCMHHMRGLMIFDIKRQTKPQHDMYSWSNVVEKQGILNNNDQNGEQKTQQLKKLLAQHQQRQKKNHREQQLTESTLQLLKKCSTRKRRHKTKCHDTIKTKEGHILPTEKGYSHYLSNTLMNQ